MIAGKEYGSGSSRDWAAKGTLLLGVRAVIAESFERIHRSNLVSMGVLPLQFKPGENARVLKLTGREVYEIAVALGGLRPRGESPCAPSRTTAASSVQGGREDRHAGRADRVQARRDSAVCAPSARQELSIVDCGLLIVD